MSAGRITLTGPFIRELVEAAQQSARANEARDFLMRLAEARKRAMKQPVSKKLGKAILSKSPLNAAAE
jgi:hypothetical protein